MCLNCVVRKSQPIFKRPISGQDKGGMLAAGCNRRKTPPGNAVRKVKGVCLKMKRCAYFERNIRFVPKPSCFPLCSNVCWT